MSPSLVVQDPREDLQERVWTTQGWYAGAHGSYHNAMHFSAPSGQPTHHGSWPKPSCPTSTDAEKAERRASMEDCKRRFDEAVAALAAYDSVATLAAIDAAAMEAMQPAGPGATKRPKP